MQDKVFRINDEAEQVNIYEQQSLQPMIASL